jgi:AcrR family transcriptional regulator
MELMMARGGETTAIGRRQAVLAAAGFLFVRQGLKGTTMEAIATEAGIAKATLYGYFADKDAVFGGLVEALVSKLEQAFDSALAGPGNVVDRLGMALAAKHEAVLKMLDGSPHAAELYGAQSRLAGPLFAALEARLEAAVIVELETAGVERARPLAQILIACAGGIGHKAQSAAEVGPAIRLLTERLLGPEVGAVASGPTPHSKTSS